MNQPLPQTPPSNYEDMVKAGMHFGRKKTVFHPNMKPFVYGTREDIHLIDLIKTGESLASAAAFMKQFLLDGKMILFVGVTKQSENAIKGLAEALNMPYVVERWLGGTLTNYKVIISRVRYLEDLEKQQRSVELDKYTKKERLLKEREIELLRQKYDGLRKLTRVPDAVFVTSLKESMLAIKEAKTVKIKTIGIVNTDSDPRLLDFPIPANDNARRSIELICQTIKETLGDVTPTVSAVTEK